MKNRRGDYKYYLLASLIIGLLVLSISLFFIFKEYFTGDDADWEVCRQSLVLRNAMPEADLKLMVESGKDVLPVKCKNSVVNINYKDVPRAENEIANAIGNCWYLTGRGEYEVFPSSKWAWDIGYTPCIVCSRIHISPEVEEYYSKEGNSIQFQIALSSNYVDKETSFWNYLNPNQSKKAFMYFNGWNNSGFSILPFVSWDLGGGISHGIADTVKSFNFPSFFNTSRGDLYVFYVEPSGKLFTSDVRDVKPYMILMQQDDLNSLNSSWTSYGFVAPELQVCSSVESVTV